MKLSANAKVGMVLVACSAAIYGLKTAIFYDVKGTSMFLFNALGVLPLNLLLISYVFNKIMTAHTSKQRARKRDMLVNTFFAEFGSKLLRVMSQLDNANGSLAECCGTVGQWEEESISMIRGTFEKHTPVLEVNANNFREIRDVLNEEHRFMLSLLQNSALMEHERFSDLIWALFHLEDELNHRNDFMLLPKTDVEHLKGDLNRVYGLIINQWVDYILYLKQDYPYLFSLAVRKTPFKTKINAIIAA